MSEFVLSGQNGLFAPQPRTNTSGPDARALRQRQILEQFRYPAKERLSQELRNLLDPQVAATWHGSNTQPIAEAAVLAGLRFLSLLTPADLSDLEVSPDDDGCVSFDWYLRKERQLSVSISAEDHLYYAAILGSIERLSGRLPFYDAIPEEINQLLRRVAR